MKSQGLFQTLQDIMEEYNGCSVPQYTDYLAMPLSRKGGQTVAASLRQDGMEC